MTPRIPLAAALLAVLPLAASAQRISDCGLGNVTLLLPDQKPPKGPGCGGVTAVFDLATANILADSAISKAESNAKRLADGLSAADALEMPYGMENMEVVGTAKLLARKAALWKDAHETLTTYKQREKEELGDEAPDAEKAKELNLVATRINVADAVRKDIAKDLARLKDAVKDPTKAESNEDVLKRKAALFARFAALKK